MRRSLDGGGFEMVADFGDAIAVEKRCIVSIAVFQVQCSRCSVPDAGLQMWSSRCGVLDAELHVLSYKCFPRIPDAVQQMQYSRYQICSRSITDAV